MGSLSTDAQRWPETSTDLERVQLELAGLVREIQPWPFPHGRPVAVAGAFIAYRTGVYGMGERGDPAWAAAAVFEGGTRTVVATIEGTVGAPYIAGYLALREGPLLERIVRELIPPPEVVLVDATGAIISGAPAWPSISVPCSTSPRSA